MEVIIRPKPIPMSVNAAIPKGYVLIKKFQHQHP